MSTSQILFAYATGSMVTVNGKTGHIQGVRNESGSGKSATPRHLLITMLLTTGDMVRDMYYHTPA